MELCTKGSLVAGEWVMGADFVPVLSPWDGVEVARVARTSPELLRQAARAAASSFTDVKSLSRGVRAAILERMAGLVGREAELLAQTMTREMGKPIKYARAEVSRCQDTLLAGAHAARGLSGREIPVDAAGAGADRLAFSRRVPVGPVLAITPFNFPLNLVAHKLAPAIAAGCPIVIKPATSAPLSAFRLGELAMEAGWPRAAISVVIADPPLAETLVQEDAFAAVSFTGSDAVGWRLKALAGQKRVTLELGGNAAVILMPDADLDAAAEKCAIAGNYQAGQSCISLQRIYCHESILAAFRKRLVAKVKSLGIGSPEDESTVVGPLIHESAAARVEAWVDEAIQLGGIPLVRGKRDRAHMDPTLIENAPTSSKLMTDEVFGPVMALQSVGSLAEAIEQVNRSRYGLQAGIFTNDLNAVLRAWDELGVGAVIHNDAPAFRVDLMPYGGVKASGLGREGPEAAVLELTDERLLILRRA